MILHAKHYTDDDKIVGEQGAPFVASRIRHIPDFLEGDFRMNSWSWSQVEHFAKELPTGLIAILLKRSFIILLIVDLLTVGSPNETFVCNGARRHVRLEATKVINANEQFQCITKQITTNHGCIFQDVVHCNNSVRARSDCL